MELVHDEMRKAVIKAFKELLSEKHLYQYVEVDIGFVPIVAEQVHKRMSPALLSHGQTIKRSTIEDAKAYCLGQTTVIWHPKGATTGSNAWFHSDFNPLEFELPTINTFCDKCQERPPFNPVPEKSFWLQGEKQDEVFCLAYQCQQCKG